MENIIKTTPIHDFEYITDSTQSYHRVLNSKGEKETILMYYQNHVYIDGEFEEKDFIDRLRENELSNKFQRDIERVNQVFDVLESWELLPTRDCNVLDLGCGYGAFILQWQKRGYGSGYGIELSPLAKLTSLISDNIKIGDINKVDELIIASDISLVTAFDIIEHLFDISNALRNIFVQMRAGAKMIIEIPILPEKVEDQFLAGYKYLYPTRHLHLYTEAGIENILFNCGFKIEKKKFLKNDMKCIILTRKD